MRTMLLVAVVSILTQQPTIPGGAYRPGNGIKSPTVVREVKPVYTPEAMRARIAGSVVLECVVKPDGTVGDVRVVKSLDKTFGLDDEAVKAARQWLFAPGTKDGVPVPVIVNVELTFVTDSAMVRGGAPPVLAWPEAFTAVGGAAPSSVGDWTDEEVQDAGIQIRFSYPPGWTFLRGATGRRWFGVQNGLRVLLVSRPEAAALPPSQPLNLLALGQVEKTLRERMAAKGRSAQLQSSGQVKTTDRLWFWYQFFVPVDDENFPSDLASSFQQGFDGATVWSFVTAAGSNSIGVDCFVMRPRIMPQAELEENIRQAAAQFRAMLEHMSIEGR